MIKDEEGKILRNLQEQVLYLSQEIEKFKGGSIKISYWVAASTDLPALMVDGNEGKFVVVGSTNPQHLYVLTKRANNGWIADNLGEYPAVVTGPQGQAGANGAQGERGFSIYGVTSQLPSAEAYQNGDMYITYDGNLYKKVNGSWLLQRNFKGPQGPIGPAGGTEVIANPEETSTEDLTKIKIDGTVYNVKGLSSAQAEWLAKALANTTWDSNGNLTVIKNLTVDMSVFADEVSATAVNTDVIEAKTSGGDVEFGSAIDMGGYAIDNASEISAGGPSQTTGLVANFHGDAQVHGDMILDSADNLVDTDGNPLITGGGINYELIEKIIVGYSLLESEPADFTTNYSNYYKTNGYDRNNVKFDYVALTSAETWEAGKYYSYDDTLTTASVVRTTMLDGTTYRSHNIQKIKLYYDKLPLPSQSSTSSAPVAKIFGYYYSHVSNQLLNLSVGNMQSWFSAYQEVDLSNENYLIYMYKSGKEGSGSLNFDNMAKIYTGPLWKDAFERKLNEIQITNCSSKLRIYIYGYIGE